MNTNFNRMQETHTLSENYLLFTSGLLYDTEAGQYSSGSFQISVHAKALRLVFRNEVKFSIVRKKKEKRKKS